jgi:hypothetical protein
MEKDPNISRLMKEGALKPAPDAFARGVMARLQEESKSSAYQPLIGRRGRIWIGISVVLIIALSLWLYKGSAPSEASKGLLQSYQITLPTLKLDLEVFSKFKPELFSQLEPSTGIAAALLALFILILFDTRIKRNRRLA